MIGKIIKGIAGFYYVYADGVIYECKAKGIFRKEHVKPLVGDQVEIAILSKEPPIGNIESLLPRKNELIRPAVANIDQAVIIFAYVQPEPNYNLLDRFLIMMQQQEIPCVICMNKTDLTTREEMDRIQTVYRGAGCKFLTTCTKTGEGMQELLEELRGKTSTVAGPSGVGKSSLINMLSKEDVSETGDLSEKIGRGKNTTRHTQIHPLGEDTFLLDTPGFSSLGLFDLQKDQLRFFYPEFAEYEGTCKYVGCTHTHEPECSVKEAVSKEVISKMRYRNYKQIYEELKLQKGY